MCDKTTQRSRIKDNTSASHTVYRTECCRQCACRMQKYINEHHIPSKLLAGLELTPWQFNYPNLLMDLASGILMHGQLNDRWAVQQGYDQLCSGCRQPSWLAATPAKVWQSSGAPAQQGPTILDRQSWKAGFWQGPLDPLPQVWLGKGKQGALQSHLKHFILVQHRPPSNSDLVWSS